MTGLVRDARSRVYVLLTNGSIGSFLGLLSIMSILMKRYTPATLPHHIIIPHYLNTHFLLLLLFIEISALKISPDFIDNGRTGKDLTNVPEMVSDLLVDIIKQPEIVRNIMTADAAINGQKDTNIWLELTLKSTTQGNKAIRRIASTINYIRSAQQQTSLVPSAGQPSGSSKQSSPESNETKFPVA